MKNIDYVIAVLIACCFLFMSITWIYTAAVHPRELGILVGGGGLLATLLTLVVGVYIMALEFLRKKKQ